MYVNCVHKMSVSPKQEWILGYGIFFIVVQNKIKNVKIKKYIFSFRPQIIDYQNVKDRIKFRLAIWMFKAASSTFLMIPWMESRASGSCIIAASQQRPDRIS